MILDGDSALGKSTCFYKIWKLMLGLPAITFYRDHLLCYGKKPCMSFHFKFFNSYLIDVFHIFIWNISNFTTVQGVRKRIWCVDVSSLLKTSPTAIMSGDFQKINYATPLFWKFLIRHDIFVGAIQNFIYIYKI